MKRTYLDYDKDNGLQTQDGTTKKPDTKFQSNYGRVRESDFMDFRKTITVKVGTDQTAFVVHESYLRRTSRFFDTVSKEHRDASWKEPRTIDLSAEDPKIFSIYLNWLYSKKIPTVNILDARNMTRHKEIHALARTYILGEILQDIEFKNAALAAFIDSILNQPSHNGVSVPSPEVICGIYEGTPANSPARRLLVDIWTDCAHKDRTNLFHRLPNDFVRDLLCAILKTRVCETKSDYAWKNVEKYMETKETARNTTKGV